jgi:hypothetical protein
MAQPEMCRVVTVNLKSKDGYQRMKKHKASRRHNKKCQVAFQGANMTGNVLEQ